VCAREREREKRESVCVKSFLPPLIYLTQNNNNN
jgi:hypothetical protein